MAADWEVLGIFVVLVDKSSHPKPPVTLENGDFRDHDMPDMYVYVQYVCVCCVDLKISKHPNTGHNFHHISPCKSMHKRVMY